jgi:hypothetical protein
LIRFNQHLEQEDDHLQLSSINCYPRQGLLPSD